jgi:hypothetical protein
MAHYGPTGQQSGVERKWEVNTLTRKISDPSGELPGLMPDFLTIDSLKKPPDFAEFHNPIIFCLLHYLK